MSHTQLPKIRGARAFFSGRVQLYSRETLFLSLALFALNVKSRRASLSDRKASTCDELSIKLSGSEMDCGLSQGLVRALPLPLGCNFGVGPQATLILSLSSKGESEDWAELLVRSVVTPSDHSLVVCPRRELYKQR